MTVDATRGLAGSLPTTTAARSMPNAAPLEGSAGTQSAGSIHGVNRATPSEAAAPGVAAANASLAAPAGAGGRDWGGDRTHSVAAGRQTGLVVTAGTAAAALADVAAPADAAVLTTPAEAIFPASPRGVPF